MKDPRAKEIRKIVRTQVIGAIEEDLGHVLYRSREKDIWVCDRCGCPFHESEDAHAEPCLDREAPASEMTARKAQAKFAPIADSYCDLERMIEERTKANPEFPKILAEAVKRREAARNVSEFKPAEDGES